MLEVLKPECQDNEVLIMVDHYKSFIAQERETHLDARNKYRHFAAREETKEHNVKRKNGPSAINLIGTAGVGWYRKARKKERKSKGGHGGFLSSFIGGQFDKQKKRKLPSYEFEGLDFGLDNLKLDLGW